MKKLMLTLFVCALAQLSFSQYDVTINAYIFEKDTQKPIPYVNIGFVEKAVGTVSDESGKFELNFDESNITKLDELQISALGYQTIRVTRDQLYRYLTNNNTIYLTPKPEVLEEVILNSIKGKPVTLGYGGTKGTFYGYWKDKIALGGEIATRIDVRKKTTLNTLFFQVEENTADSIKIRVNVYDIERRKPGKKILKENVFAIVKKNQKEVRIDLNPYNIKVEEDFIIGIELLEVYGDGELAFVITGREHMGDSYRRFISQDNWDKTVMVAMNLGIEATKAVKANKLEKESRPLPERITLYWDTSLAHKRAEKAHFLELLKRYLKELRHVELKVVPFSYSSQGQSVFSIRKGNSEALLEYLNQLKYHGAGDYSKVLHENIFNADRIFLFTDGNAALSDLSNQVDVPVFTMSSEKTANHQDLQQLAFFSDGHYINTNSYKLKEALEALTYYIDDTIDYSALSTSEQRITGIVKTEKGPIQGASIEVEDSFSEVISDFNGNFSVPASIGDKLIVNSFGMLPTTYEVERLSGHEIIMKPDGELLDEIVIRAKKKKELIETRFGKRDKDAAGYALGTITADEIGPQYINLATLMVGRFAGVQVDFANAAYQTPRFVIRGGGGSLSRTPAMFDIDGITYGPGQDIPFVDLQLIHSITVLRSIAATNRYGSIGSGGAIVIRTKMMVRSEDQEQLQNKLLVKGNDYKENVLMLSAKQDVIPGYIAQLERAKSYDEAKRIYFELLQGSASRNIPFYINCAEYFQKWDRIFANQIESNIAVVAGDNVKALRAFAFKLEQQQKWELLHKVRERLVTLAPQQAQSYLDLAKSYRYNKQYNEALNLYKRMLANAIEDVDFSGILERVENEIMHVLAFHRSKVDYQDLPVSLRTASFKKDLRIVFEWNNPSAEFELQFVNPNNKYFIWSHSVLDNKERLEDEVKKGYFTEEFIVDDTDPGTWLINIENLKEEDKRNPTFLKYTVYKDFGLSTETKRVKVIRLYNHQTKVTLDKIFL